MAMQQVHADQRLRVRGLDFDGAGLTIPENNG